MADLVFLHEEPDFVVINKPSGLLVHPSRLAKDRVTCLSLARDRLGRRVYPVHRLDRQTSGVLVLALSPEVARCFQEGFESRTHRKSYLAVVRGYLAEQGEVRKMAGAREEVTTFRCLARAEVAEPVGRYASARYSLAELDLETGRMHQLRRHLHSISHPVIGDTVYGDGRHNRFFRERFGVRRLLLHARSLEFAHPRSGRRVAVTAPLPGDFEAVLARTGLRAR